MVGVSTKGWGIGANIAESAQSGSHPLIAGGQLVPLYGAGDAIAGIYAGSSRSPDCMLNPGYTQAVRVVWLSRAVTGWRDELSICVGPPVYCWRTLRIISDPTCLVTQSRSKMALLLG